MDIAAADGKGAEGKEAPRRVCISRKVNYSKDLGRETERERERERGKGNNHAGGNNNPVRAW